MQYKELEKAVGIKLATKTIRQRMNWERRNEELGLGTMNQNVGNISEKIFAFLPLTGLSSTCVLYRSSPSHYWVVYEAISLVLGMRKGHTTETYVP